LKTIASQPMGTSAFFKWEYARQGLCKLLRILRMKVL
jgi:hypothetical protein